MRNGGKAASRQVVLWLGIALCLSALAVIFALSRQSLVVAFATLGAMAVLALSLGAMPLLRQAAVPWSRLRRGLRRPDEPRFDTLPVPLLRFGPEGALIAANAAARAVTGVQGPALAHEMFEDLGRPIAEWLRDVATGRHPGGTEMLRLRQAGEGGDFVQLTAQRAGEDEVLVVLQDATALKRLEAQFTQSQKMQAVGQFAGGIAHDFNNLLTAITGHCDLLLLRHRADDPDHEDLQQIQQNAYRAGNLIKQLLAFSRKQTLVLEQVDLAEVMGQLAHLLKRLMNTAVRVELVQAAEPITLRADKSQLEQVIINLAVNARDAMALGGVLRIETEYLALPAPKPRDRAVIPAGAYALIRVQDTGSGIAPEHIGKIFDPFFTTKRAGEGTGLGLSTVYGIVKQSGGYIFVSSTPGEGTEFELWFPASIETSAAPPKPAPAARLAANEGVVLLVEDEAAVRTFAARALRMRGLTVLEAESGEQALEVVAKPVRIDILVSDVILPGLDGPQWVRQALASRPGLPVVFMSGYAAEAPSEAQSRIANSVFLSKPFTLADLSDTVARQLPRRSAQLAEALSVS